MIVVPGENKEQPSSYLVSGDAYSVKGAALPFGAVKVGIDTTE